MDKIGILCVSHSHDLALGLQALIQQVTKDLPLAFVGGIEENEIGTSFDTINQAIEELAADRILAFFDLGSARMNLELASDFSEKEILIQPVAFVEGTYAAAALLQAGASEEDILKQLSELEIRK